MVRLRKTIFTISPLHLEAVDEVLGFMKLPHSIFSTSILKMNKSYKARQPDFERLSNDGFLPQNDEIHMEGAP